MFRFLSYKKLSLCTKRVDNDLLLNYLYHNTLVGNIVSEANNPASEASLANIGAKRQFFASTQEISQTSKLKLAEK